MIGENFFILFWLCRTVYINEHILVRFVCASLSLLHQFVKLQESIEYWFCVSFIYFVVRVREYIISHIHARNFQLYYFIVMHSTFEQQLAKYNRWQIQCTYKRLCDSFLLPFFKTYVLKITLATLFVINLFKFLKKSFLWSRVSLYQFNEWKINKTHDG